MNYIFPLPQPVRPKQSGNETAIFPGHRYPLRPEAIANGTPELAHAFQNGLVGAYRISQDKAEVEALDLNAQPMQGFVWDTALLNPPLRHLLVPDQERPRSAPNNRLTLIDARLDVPSVEMEHNTPTLTVTPRFELEWDTEAYASQLGVVRLVESLRVVHFEDGESTVLLDTEAAGVGPVLYLSQAVDQQAVIPICAFQAQAQQQCIEYGSAVTQLIPAELAGKAVSSVSVLEKYTVYFMQNAAPDQPDRYIWVPVHLPVVWGWSIRVQQRYDGVWDIFRKKLIMPMPSTEAPALPLWQSNSLRCLSLAVM